MMQHGQRRLELLGLRIFSELTWLTLVLGSPVFVSVCGFTAVGSLNQQKLQKKKEKRRNSEL